MNPLLKTFDTPFETIPFEKIEPAHFLPAFDEAFAMAADEIRKIEKDPAPAEFMNTVEKLEKAGELLGRLSAILFNLNHAETNDEIQKLTREMAPRLTAFSNDITLNPVLFGKISKVLEDLKESDLSIEERMLLDKTHRNFIRSGAHLGETEKEAFRQITGRLSELSVQFGENVLAETNDWSMHITEEADLAGLPGDLIHAAAAEAANRKKSGWIFSLQMPSYLPFIKYSARRELRKQMFLAYGCRCLQNNKHDNREIIREIVNLRFQMAGLLGYDDYASFVLENRMAGDPAKVTMFLEELKEVYMPPATKEVGELRQFAKDLEGIHDLMPWDWACYSEKLKEKKYAVNDELTRPYFELQRTVEGVFDLAGRLYGIKFVSRNDIQVYHKDVSCFEVLNEKGKHLAILYMDYFPRQGKKPGAWMTGFVQQYRSGKRDIRPHVSLVFNFPRPNKDKPSLLNYGELRTLLHEFGHALHGMLSDVQYKSLSGTSVYRDFVELPSQIMENWAEQKEWLQTVGVHYLTGEAIDIDLITKLLASRNFHEGYLGIRQISFGMLDMAWHSVREPFSGDVTSFEKELMAPLYLLPKIEGTAMSPSFNHIFGGGYAAGYYGYKWAEVLDADAFSRFLENGIFDRKTAGEFREKILSRGGSKHPMQLYVDFMGREPEMEALLRRSGFGGRSQ